MNEKLVNLKEKLIKEYSDFVISELKSVADNIMLDLSNTECMFEYSTLGRSVIYNLVNKQELFGAEELLNSLNIGIYADFKGKENLYENDKADKLKEEFAYIKLYYCMEIENNKKIQEISTYKLEVKEDMLNFLAYKPAKEQFETK